MPPAPPYPIPDPHPPINCVVINGVEYALVPTGRKFAPVAAETVAVVQPEPAEEKEAPEAA